MCDAHGMIRRLAYSGIHSSYSILFPTSSFPFAIVIFCLPNVLHLAFSLGSVGVFLSPLLILILFLVLGLLLLTCAICGSIQSIELNILFRISSLVDSLRFYA